MKAIELFAGVGGFRLGLERAGHQVVWANEWDKWACDTYDKNFGESIDRRDITTIPERDIPSHDIICGGFPCQAFSVAGQRLGFAETRGTLFFEIARIAKYHRTPFLFLENVKGLLSHDRGNTFETILRTLDKLGYDLQWQVLNSKDFGVPQNRERVFIIGHLRGQPRPEVFPIAASDRATSFSNTVRTGGKGSLTQKHAWDLIQIISPSVRDRERVYDQSGIAPTMTSAPGGGKQPFIKVDGFVKRKRNEFGKQIRKDYEAGKVEARLKDMRDWEVVDQHHSNTLTGVEIDNRLSVGGRIRRLTPLECERLQGFPNNWTAGVSDTQRYKQMGNAVTVNVIEAIARRLPCTTTSTLNKQEKLPT